MSHHMRGFTLIELMIVVAIVGILAAISYPLYEEQVRKSRRADATAVLLQAAQQLERYYTQNNNYTNFNLATYGLDEAPIDGTAKYYDLTFDNTGADGTTNDRAQAYTLEATPKNAQTPDANCGTLSYTHLAVKGESGSRDVDYCW